MFKSSITDKPRNSSIGDGDQFGIEPFEKGLTAFINNSNTPITVALQGEWGSGKTSLMNSLRQKLSNQNDSRFYSVWLNTWEYALMKDASSTLIDIISKLIEEVSIIANIDKEKKQNLMRNVRKIGFSALKVASSLNGLASSAINEIEKSVNETPEVTIGQIRIELENIIDQCISANQDKKGIVFFIDDLDRIDPPVAVNLLELLKNVFTLKNCVFVLAIDYDVVIKGLEPKFGKYSAENEREFRSFFDKIIQVPFAMPVSNYNVDEFLKESLKSIDYLNGQQILDTDLISKFSEVANLSVGKNPRALKRLMNSLSLISCINSARNINSESDQLNENLELLVNFALVSVQIAYPQVYRLLSLYPGFDRWDESIAIQMNLKTLDEHSIQKLNQSEEFDEDWEKVLFRLCENDHYLKKQALNISRLLNTLRVAIKEQSEEIEDTIGAVISLSSVTNLEAFDKPEVDYHKGNFLKHLRNLLIPQLKIDIPEVENLIKPQGKRVQSNAFIKFTENDWGNWIKLTSHPYDGGVRLIVTSDKWMSNIGKFSDLKDAINSYGLVNELENIEKEYESFRKEFEEFKPSSFFEHVSQREGCFILNIYSYQYFPNINTFFEKSSIQSLSKVIKGMHKTLIQLEGLRLKIIEARKNQT